MGFVQVTSPLKQFFWDAKDNRTVGRGIGGYYTNDTTVASTTSGTAVTLKTYTFTSGPNTNYIRIRVYGYVSAGTGNYAIVINGTSVATGTTTSTTATLVIEYFGSLIPNTSYTININAYNSVAGDTTAVSQVSINAGFGLTSTTAVNILTVTLGTNDTYTLNVNGNFGYSLKIFYWLKANRKTTATATIQSNLPNDTAGSTYPPSAADDTDNAVFLSNRVGNYATSFTISGNVGAAGDVIIIIEVYCQISLGGGVGINENGAMFITARVVSLDGRNIYYPRVSAYTQSGGITLWQVGNGSDVTASTIIPSVNISAFGNFWSGYYPYSDAEVLSVTLYLEIIIIGA